MDDGFVMDGRNRTETAPHARSHGHVHPAKCLYLTYHRVAVQPSTYPYTVTSRLFEDHLQCISRLQKDTSGQYVFPQVTFDDGHSSNYSQAAPLLAKHDLPAQFFLTAGWIGSRPDFMSWPQAVELLSAGFDIGSHSWSHQLLTRCSDSELDQELRRSKGVLEDRLGTSVSSLSLPGGRWNRRVLAACADAGYDYVFTSDPTGAVVLREGVQLVSRVNIPCSLRACDLTSLLDVHSLGHRRKILFHHAKCATRRVLGERLYQHLWCGLHGWKNDET